MPLAFLAGQHLWRRQVGVVECSGGEADTTLLGDEGVSGHERGGPGAGELGDQGVGWRTVAGASPCARAGRRASRTGAQTRGLPVLFKGRKGLPRIGFTRQGGAASCLQGVDCLLTVRTERPVDGALCLRLTGLGGDEHPAWLNPAVSRRPLLIARALLPRGQGLGGDWGPGGVGFAHGRRHAGASLPRRLGALRAVASRARARAATRAVTPDGECHGSRGARLPGPHAWPARSRAGPPFASMVSKARPRPSAWRWAGGTRGALRREGGRCWQHQGTRSRACWIHPCPWSPRALTGSPVVSARLAGWCGVAGSLPAPRPRASNRPATRPEGVQDWASVRRVVGPNARRCWGGDGTGPPAPHQQDRNAQREVRKVSSEPLARALRVSARHGTEQGPRFRLMLLRYGIQDVCDPVVPAALLGCGRRLFREGRPQAQMAISHGTAPGLHPTGAEIPPHGPPGLFRLPLATLHRQHDLLARGQNAGHDQ